jgi:flagellar M-ring protein FliF
VQPWQTTMQQLRGLWAKMKWGQRAAAVAVLIGLIFAIISVVNPLTTSRYVPLFTRLRPSDAAEVIAVLKERNIPYRLEAEGTAILVPEDQVHETRLGLTSQGLPRGGVVGFEIFQESQLGATEFDRRLRYNWALQGELTRTIRELAEVEDARVHIVLPERSPFLTQEKLASASVLLVLQPGARLTASQVRGIAHLVARSVEGLTPEQVTILDSGGNILSESLGPQQALLNRLEIERAYEKDTEMRIQSMLEKVFGLGNAIVRASVQLNLDMQEEKSEIFEPSLRDRGIVRSEQLSEETGQGARAGGPAGVASNIPGYTAAGEYADSFERKESVRNYEINRREQHLITAPGRVERLSITVWVNEADPGALQGIQDAVSSAVGLDPSRGDQLIVESMPFHKETVPVTAPLIPAAAKPPWLLILGALATTLLLIVFFRRRQVQQAIDITLEEPATPEITMSEEDRERKELQDEIRRMVTERPDEVAQVLRTWLTED